MRTTTCDRCGTPLRATGFRVDFVGQAPPESGDLVPVGDWCSQRCLVAQLGDAGVSRPRFGETRDGLRRLRLEMQR